MLFDFEEGEDAREFAALAYKAGWGYTVFGPVIDGEGYTVELTKVTTMQEGEE